ncbi:MAG: PQQ-dependent sugar dehydrogenase [Armatimonadota bacterium]|nr:PQQ-dependent sugar dehydrogenase [Armatimonadota bacterium]
MLRIDVEGGEPYGIPPDNPFVGRGMPEIWAYGLRNPWRFSFDRADGRLLLADVGQGRREEVNLIGRGKNYGWNVIEGSLCFEPPTGCDSTGLELPIAEYGARDDGACAVTGGYVYRGTRYPALRGMYFFGDYCSGQIWSLTQRSGGRWAMNPVLRGPIRISSFGEDEAGEIYVVDHGGAIYRLVAR